MEDRVCEATAVAVDSEPRWDRTKEGICFANSNVPEWILQRGASPTKSGYMAVPFRVNMLGARRWSPLPTVLRYPEAPDSLQGLRLYRTVVSPR